MQRESYLVVCSSLNNSYHTFQRVTGTRVSDSNSMFYINFNEALFSFTLLFQFCYLFMHNQSNNFRSLLIRHKNIGLSCLRTRVWVERHASKGNLNIVPLNFLSSSVLRCRKKKKIRFSSFHITCFESIKNVN